MKACKCEKGKLKAIPLHAANMQIVRIYVHVHSFSNPTLNGGQ